MFVIVYFNDIFIYNNSEDKHQGYLAQIIVVLKGVRLYGNLKICTFFSSEVAFFATLRQPKE